jgi:hypothetical protein
VVVKGGNHLLYYKWGKVGKALCGIQSTTDILTKTRKLTYLFINNSPL